jgi:hypothetical protein
MHAMAYLLRLPGDVPDPPSSFSAPGCCALQPSTAAKLSQKWRGGGGAGHKALAWAKVDEHGAQEACLTAMRCWRSKMESGGGDGHMAPTRAEVDERRAREA